MAIDKQTMGVVSVLLGLVSFLQSFTFTPPVQYVYLFLGLILIIVGGFFAFSDKR